jgi:hypothetical protein
MRRKIDRKAPEELDARRDGSQEALEGVPETEAGASKRTKAPPKPRMARVRIRGGPSQGQFVAGLGGQKRTPE